MKENKGTERNYENSQEAISKLAISSYLSITTLSVNGLSLPIKRHRVAEWVKNKTYLYCCL